jgi:hypothetical protein
MAPLERQTATARTEALLVEHVEGETVVYDLRNDTVHCLNPLTTAVWRRCDGRTPVAEIPDQVAADLGDAVPPEAVWLALSELAKADLLEGSVALPAEARALSRRQMLARLGAVGGGVMAASLITSAVVPEAAAAASCTKGHAGDACSGGGNCCSGVCSGGHCVGG